MSQPAQPAQPDHRAATLGAAGTLARLHEQGISAYLGSYSALDRYFGVATGGSEPLHVVTPASLGTLAQVYDELEFPGHPLFDATVLEADQRYLFRCTDSAPGSGADAVAPFTVLDLLFDPTREVFLDPRDIYGDLRREELVPQVTDQPWWLVLSEAAQIVSRYHYEVDLDVERIPGPPPEVPIGYQRHVLQGVLLGRWPAKGMQLLLRAGLIRAWWPELAAMANIAHTKDFHPEGDVWQHTLATFAHRKKPHLVLSLALLLHDSGKPHAVPSGEKKFFAHAEIGATVASRFLRRLEFDAATIGSVDFLVRNHMMPAALRRLPTYRAEALMAREQFPWLLELYRADMMATYASPEPYYDACRLYRRYLKVSDAAVRYGQAAGGRPRRRSRGRRYRR